MKRKKRTQRLLAMLLTLMLCVGEFASTGFNVLAADDEIADTVSDEEIVSDNDNVVPDEDKSGREASGNETTEPEEEMSEEIDLNGNPGGYGVWIGGVELDESNKDSLPKLKGGSGSYDPVNKILKLKDVTGINNSDDYAVKAESDLTIEVEGEVDLSPRNAEYGIYTNGKLTIRNKDGCNASLKIDMGINESERSESDAIEAKELLIEELEGSLSIQLMTAAKAMRSFGIVILGDLTINGGVLVVNVWPNEVKDKCHKIGIRVTGNYNQFGGGVIVRANPYAETEEKGKTVFHSIAMEVDGKVSIKSGYTLLYACKAEYIYSYQDYEGIWHSTNPTCMALKAGEEITFGSNMGVLDPEGAGVKVVDGKYTIANEDPVRSVTIGNKSENTKYNLWVGDMQVIAYNMSSIPCDTGTASFDPETNTLTFNDAKLTTFSQHYVTKATAAVQSKGMPLKIKGKLGIISDGSDGTENSKYGILIVDSTTKASIDADIRIKDVKTAGIWGSDSDIGIEDGRIEVENSESIGAKGSITLAEEVGVISPEGATFRKVDGVTRLYKSSTSSEVVLGAVIGTTKASYTVTFNLNGHGDAIEPVKVTEGNTVAAPTVPIAEGWIFGGWYTDESCTTAYDFTTPVTADITLYAKWTGVEYTVTFDMGGKATNIEQKVENGKTATRPENNPTADGFKFVDWYKDAAFTTLFDFASVITGDTTIYAKWVENTVVTYTVTFDANGVEAVNMPAVQNVEEGGTATKPVTDPSAEGYKFEGWYKEADGINEFDFTKVITENTVIFAKWSKIGTPDPEPGHSPLDPKPEIKDDTTELWLVKGQKFMIGTDWKVADDKVSKKYVSISKKGQLKAKKVDGGAEVKIKNSVTNKELTLHISKPEIDKKLTLTIVSANTVSSNKINLTKDEHLDVLYYSAAPDVATVAQDGTVTAVAKGKAKITAYINGSAYNCNVTVKETVTPLERTIHVTKGASKPVLKIQGVKKVDWKSASENTAKVEKSKVKAGNAAGNTVLTASANGLEYKINVFVEDPAVSMTETAGVAFETKSATKYEIMIPKGKEVTLSFASMDQPVVFKSTKPDIAFVDENGNVEARSKGKGKFTAKINGKTITITVKVTE